MKCDHPECPGHLGKFDSCLAEVVYEQSLDGDIDSTGTSDFRGHFTLMRYTADYTTRTGDVMAWALSVILRELNDDGTLGSDMAYAIAVGDDGHGPFRWTRDRSDAYFFDGVPPFSNDNLRPVQVEAGRKVTVPAGWYIVESANSGAVTLHTFASETEAREFFRIEEQAYAKYDDQD